MKNTLKLNHTNRTIVMDKTFAKFAADTKSSEYAHLQQVRQDYPLYTVVQRHMPVTINQDIRALIPGEFILPRFAYHLIAGHSKEILTKTKKQGGTVDSLDTKLLMDFMVSIPSIEEQQRIVSILDSFDTLCSDLQSGLPAEIEARRKQYEYYRDKLLTFKPLA